MDFSNVSKTSSMGIKISDLEWNVQLPENTNLSRK